LQYLMPSPKTLSSPFQSNLERPVSFTAGEWRKRTRRPFRQKPAPFRFPSDPDPNAG
jgi:hypothetical protein